MDKQQMQNLWELLHDKQEELKKIRKDIETQILIEQGLSADTNFDQYHIHKLK